MSDFDFKTFKPSDYARLAADLIANGLVTGIGNVLCDVEYYLFPVKVGQPYRKFPMGWSWSALVYPILAVERELLGVGPLDMAIYGSTLEERAGRLMKVAEILESRGQ